MLEELFIECSLVNQFKDTTSCRLLWLEKLLFYCAFSFTFILLHAILDRIAMQYRHSAYFRKYAQYKYRLGSYEYFVGTLIVKYMKENNPPTFLILTWWVAIEGFYYLFLTVFDVKPPLFILEYESGSGVSEWTSINTRKGRKPT